jgi:flagellum-specific ATP synthase
VETFAKYLQAVERTDPIKYTGRVIKVQGLLIESRGPSAVIGEVCQIIVPKGRGQVWAEVVGLREDAVQLMAYTEFEGIEVGDLVIASGEMLTVQVSDKLLGRTLDSMGRPIDSGADLHSAELYPVMASPPNPLTRRRIKERVVTGVRAIDGLLPVGKGQRLGIFAGSGVGKSTLLGMIARNTDADVNVIALIGERGREVREFIENDLGEEGMRRSVVIVSLSNTPPLARIRAAYVATAVAEYFRDRGQSVMMLFDSVTRFARAQREIGLAIGEPPATRGYTPSVFETLPKLLERAGTSDKGSITGFYTILVDGDDMDEPVSDTVRGVLDGHIVLSRKLAQRYHYPAIDVLASISRLSNAVTGPVTQKAMGVVRKGMAVYQESEAMINVGAYVKGTNPAIEDAIQKRDGIEAFLIQGVAEPAPIESTIQSIADISGVSIPREEVSAYLAQYPGQAQAQYPGQAPSDRSARSAAEAAESASGGDPA